MVIGNDLSFYRATEIKTDVLVFTINNHSNLLYQFIAFYKNCLIKQNWDFLFKFALTLSPILETTPVISCPTTAYNPGTEPQS